MTWWINQVLTQKDTFLKKPWNKKWSPDSYWSKCILIAWNSAELNNEDKIKSFELFRWNLKDVDIITFDELFVKIQKLLEVFQGVSIVESQEIENIDEYEDIPF